MKMLLIYPQLGVLDGLARDIPLSLIYAASHSVKKGHEVRILDLRNLDGDIPGLVLDESKNGYGLIGFSVMTGLPLKDTTAYSK